MVRFLMSGTAKKLLKKIESEYVFFEHQYWDAPEKDNKVCSFYAGICNGLEIAHRIVCEHFGIEHSMPVIDPDDQPCPPPPKGEE